MTKEVNEIEYIMRAVSKERSKRTLMAPLVTKDVIVGCDNLRMHWDGRIDMVTEEQRNTYLGIYPDISKSIPKKDPILVFEFRAGLFENIYRGYKSVLKVTGNPLLIKTVSNQIEISIGEILVTILDAELTEGKEVPIEVRLNARFLKDATKHAGRSFLFHYYGKGEPILIAGKYNALIMPERES
jgi:hypothetical protein